MQQEGASPSNIGTLLIRADGGAAIGGGHVTRCLALAEHWLERGGRVVWVSVKGSEVPAALERERVDCHFVSSRAPDACDAQETVTLGRQQAADVVLLDGYHFDGQYQERMKQLGVPLAVVDDYAHLPLYHADIILNQNVGAESLHYSCSGKPTMLLGSRFALLRSHFRSRKTVVVSQPQTVSNVLISFGMSRTAEPYIEMTLKFLEELKGLRVVVIKENMNATNETMKSGSARVQFLWNVENMATVMESCDLAISAAGSTVWELAFMGVPMIVFPIVENQVRIARELSKRGIAERLSEFSPAHLKTAVSALLADQERRQTMSRLGQELIDGHGASRVVDGVLKAISKIA